MNSCHIYMKWKEGAREQDTGETERERESAGEGGQSQNEAASLVKMAVEEADHFGSEQDQNRRIILIVGNYFNDRDRRLGLQIV